MTQKKQRTKQKAKTSTKNLFQSSSSSSSAAAVLCSLFDNDNGGIVVEIFHFDNLIDNPFEVFFVVKNS